MRFIQLAVLYIFDFVRANIALAIQALSPKMRLPQQCIEVPTRARSPFEILALSNLITFTPGTLMLDVAPGDRILVHVLGDAAQAERGIRDRLERLLIDGGDRGP